MVKKMAKSSTKKKQGPIFQERIQRFLEEEDFVHYVCLMDLQGERLAEVTDRKTRSAEIFPQLRSYLYELASSYPRKDLNRIIVEDEEGTAFLLTVCKDRILTVIADGNAPLGSISRAVGKITEKLEEAVGS